MTTAIDIQCTLQYMQASAAGSELTDIESCMSWSRAESPFYRNAVLGLGLVLTNNALQQTPADAIASVFSEKSFDYTFSGSDADEFARIRELFCTALKIKEPNIFGHYFGIDDKKMLEYLHNECERKASRANLTCYAAFKVLLKRNGILGVSLKDFCNDIFDIFFIKLQQFDGAGFTFFCTESDRWEFYDLKDWLVAALAYARDTFQSWSRKISFSEQETEQNAIFSGNPTLDFFQLESYFSVEINSRGVNKSDTSEAQKKFEIAYLEVWQQYRTNRSDNIGYTLDVGSMGLSGNMQKIASLIDFQRPIDNFPSVIYGNGYTVKKKNRQFFRIAEICPVMLVGCLNGQPDSEPPGAPSGAKPPSPSLGLYALAAWSRQAVSVVPVGTCEIASTFKGDALGEGRSEPVDNTSYVWMGELFLGLSYGLRLERYVDFIQSNLYKSPENGDFYPSVITLDDVKYYLMPVPGNAQKPDIGYYKKCFDNKKNKPLGGQPRISTYPTRPSDVKSTYLCATKVPFPSLKAVNKGSFSQALAATNPHWTPALLKNVEDRKPLLPIVKAVMPARDSVTELYRLTLDFENATSLTQQEVARQFTQYHTTSRMSVLTFWAHSSGWVNAAMKNEFVSDTQTVVRTNQEWCHLIGHGDKGEDAAYNLVAGSHQCNTLQLAIEMALRNFEGKIHLQRQVSAYLMDANGIFVGGSGLDKKIKELKNLKINMAEDAKRLKNVASFIILCFAILAGIVTKIAQLKKQCELLGIVSATSAALPDRTEVSPGEARKLFTMCFDFLAEKVPKFETTAEAGIYISIYKLINTIIWLLELKRELSDNERIKINENVTSVLDESEPAGGFESMRGKYNAAFKKTRRNRAHAMLDNFLILTSYVAPSALFIRYAVFLQDTGFHGKILDVMFDAQLETFDKNEYRIFNGSVKDGIFHTVKSYLPSEFRDHLFSKKTTALSMLSEWSSSFENAHILVHLRFLITRLATEGVYLGVLVKISDDLRSLDVKVHDAFYISGNLFFEQTGNDVTFCDGDQNGTKLLDGNAISASAPSNAFDEEIDPWNAHKDNYFFERRFLRTHTHETLSTLAKNISDPELASQSFELLAKMDAVNQDDGFPPGYTTFSLIQKKNLSEIINSDLAFLHVLHQWCAMSTAPTPVLAPLHTAV